VADHQHHLGEHKPFLDQNYQLFYPAPNLMGLIRLF